MNKQEIIAEAERLLLAALVVVLLALLAPRLAIALAPWLLPHLWNASPIEAAAIVLAITERFAVPVGMGTLILVRPPSNTSWSGLILPITLCAIPLWDITSLIQKGWAEESKARTEILANPQPPNQS